MSSTILPFINPPAQAQDTLNVVAGILSTTNTFSVPQNFAGIANSGSESCASLTVGGNASVTGTLNAGATTVASLVITGAGVDNAAFTANSLGVTTTATVGGLLSANGGLAVAGAASFDTAPTMSGANIAAATIPGASLVATSVNTAQLADNGVTQLKVVNGYVDLSSAQTVEGIKTFSAAPVLSGASITANTIPGASLVAASVVQAKVANGYVDLSSAQTVGGAKTFSAAAGFSSAVTLSGGVILPVTQTALSIVSGVVAVNLNSQSLNKFSLAMSAAITAFTFTNVIVNATFEIYFTNTSGSNKQINKNLSSGAVTCVNSLSGNTLIANSSVWLIRGNVVSSTVVVMEFVNYT